VVVGGVVCGGGGVWGWVWGVGSASSSFFVLWSEVKIFFSWVVVGGGGGGGLTDALLVLITFNSTSTIQALAAGSAEMADHEHSLPVHRISKLHSGTCR